MTHLEIEETRLIDEGTGDRCIVLLHGWCCRTGDFARVVERLRHDVRVVVPDWGTRALNRGGEVSFSEIGHDLISLLDELGVRNPLLGGHSQGGFMAAWLAKERAMKIQGLLALETMLPVTRELSESFLDWIPRLQPDSVVDFWRSTLHDIFFVESESGPEMESITRGMMSQPFTLARDLLEANCTMELDQSLSHVDVPVHLLKAQRTPLELEALQARVPQATCESIAGAGHFIMIYHPDRVVDSIKALAKKNAT